MFMDSGATAWPRLLSAPAPWVLHWTSPVQGKYSARNLLYIIKYSTVSRKNSDVYRLPLLCSLCDELEHRQTDSAATPAASTNGIQNRASLFCSLFFPHTTKASPCKEVNENMVATRKIKEKESEKKMM